LEGPIFFRSLLKLGQNDIYPKMLRADRGHHFQLKDIIYIISSGVTGIGTWVVQVGALIKNGKKKVLMLNQINLRKILNAKLIS
jgi:hypothetical protein